MNKTKIEWCDYSWNPIKGLCPEACSYCYARAIYKRFELEPEPRLDGYALRDPIAARPLSGKRVFVCSTFELFNPVADQWRDRIFPYIEGRPDVTFIVLTKRPERIDRVMPANVWLGVSVTGPGDMWRIEKMFEAMAPTRFISFEPILGPVAGFTDHLSGIKREMLQWVIFGRMTGHGHKHDPKGGWVKDALSAARFYRLPIFMKNNLKSIWPGPLIQEFPEACNVIFPGAPRSQNRENEA